MAVEAPYRPGQAEKEVLSYAHYRFHRAAEKLNKYLGATTVFGTQDTAVTGSVGLQAFKAANETIEKRNTKTAVSQDVRQSVQDKIGQLNLIVSNLSQAETAVEAYKAVPTQNNLTPQEEIHLQDEFLALISALPNSVANRLLDPKPQLLKEERTKLAGAIDAVAEKRRVELLERVRQSAPPMEEQDRELERDIAGIAMWQEIFEMFDARMGYDPAIAAQRIFEMNLQKIMEAHNRPEVDPKILERSTPIRGQFFKTNTDNRAGNSSLRIVEALAAMGYEISLQKPTNYGEDDLAIYADRTAFHVYWQIENTPEMKALYLATNAVVDSFPNMDNCSWDEITRARIVALYWQTKAEGARNYANKGYNPAYWSTISHEDEEKAKQALPKGTQIPTVGELQELVGQVVKVKGVSPRNEGNLIIKQYDKQYDKLFSKRR